MKNKPHGDKSVVSWLLESGREWFELATSGPLGYEAYARLRFVPDPEFDGQDLGDVDLGDDDGPGPTELWQLAVAVSHLAQHTTTPDRLFFLIWDGWATSYDNVGAARVDLEDEQFGVVRRYYLFTGNADLFSWTPPHGPRSSPRPVLPAPAFIWPADRAWCIADDIDPHFATIAATETAIAAITTDARIDVSSTEDPTIGPPRYPLRRRMSSACVPAVMAYPSTWSPFRSAVVVVVDPLGLPGREPIPSSVSADQENAGCSGVTRVRCVVQNKSKSDKRLIQ